MTLDELIRVELISTSTVYLEMTPFSFSGVSQVIEMERDVIVVALKNLGSEGTGIKAIQKFQKISQYSSTLKIWYGVDVDNVMPF